MGAPPGQAPTLVSPIGLGRGSPSATVKRPVRVFVPHNTGLLVGSSENTSGVCTPRWSAASRNLAYQAAAGRRGARAQRRHNPPHAAAAHTPYGYARPPAGCCTSIWDMGTKASKLSPKKACLEFCSSAACARCRDAPLAGSVHSLGPRECTDPTGVSRLDAVHVLEMELQKVRRRTCHRRRPGGGGGV